LLVALLCLSGRAAPAQQPDSTAGAPAAADTARAAGVDTMPGVFSVDTILVVEDTKGLLWRDWYVNSDIGNQVDQAIKRRGQLPGRTWITSSAPIRNLALGRPAGEMQTLSFVDYGEDQGFWSSGDVEYSYAFEGPFHLRARGTVTSAKVGPTKHLVRIPLPLKAPADLETVATHERVGRLDIAYRNVRPRTPATAVRGRFSVYLYYLNPELGYRIVGVGY
jgi:hypothetical protein